MWVNAQPDGRPAEHRWRPLFNAVKFGWRPLLDAVQYRCQNAKPVEICRVPQTPEPISAISGPHHVPKYGKHPISDRWD